MVIDRKSFNALKDSGFSNIYYLPNPVLTDFEIASKEMPLGQNRMGGRVVFVGPYPKGEGNY